MDGRDANNQSGGSAPVGRIPSVPNWQLSASGTYTLPGMWGVDKAFVSASWQFVGERITRSGDQEPGVGRFAHMLDFGDGLDGTEVTELDPVLDPYHLFNLNSGLVEAGDDGAGICDPPSADDGAKVPWGGCARVKRSLRARTKSRASMAAQVRCPVYETWPPWHGRQTSPVAAGQASAKGRCI